MGALFQILWWAAYLTEHLAPDNVYLNNLPPDIVAHLIAIGEWIVKVMQGQA